MSRKKVDSPQLKVESEKRRRLEVVSLRAWGQRAAPLHDRDGG